MRDAATERFEAALEGLPVPLMDALPALRAAPPRSGIFFKGTIHLTPRGHQVLAEALERFLLERVEGESFALPHERHDP